MALVVAADIDLVSRFAIELGLQTTFGAI